MGKPIKRKRGRPKNRRAGCLKCKPWKINGAGAGHYLRHHSDLRRQPAKSSPRFRAMNLAFSSMPALAAAEALAFFRSEGLPRRPTVTPGSGTGTKRRRLSPLPCFVPPAAGGMDG
jgi:hypothetical protein